MNIKKYSPQILTGLGIVGLVGTVVMAVKATSKCETLIEEAEATLREMEGNEDTELDKKETAKCFVKAYWPTAAMGIVTAACFIASNCISEKNEAVVTAALGAAEASLHRFQEATFEVVSKKTADEIKAKVADKQLKEKPLKNDSEVKITNKGDTLCFDCYTGRYFKSDLETIRRIVNDMNENLLDGDFVSLNDFYYNIGLPEVEMGDDLGWHAYSEDEKIDISYAARIAENGEPCIVISYKIRPSFCSGKYY